MAGSRKAQHDISPRMRNAFFEGFKMRASSLGKTLPEYAETLWEEDWKACIAALAKFLPTESKVTGSVQHDHSHRIEVIQKESRRVLDSFAGITDEIRTEASLQDQSVLPDPSDIQSH